MTIVTHFSYMKGTPHFFNIKSASRIIFGVGIRFRFPLNHLNSFKKNRKHASFFHLGYTRVKVDGTVTTYWFVSVYIFKPCIHLIFWDCAMYFDHGVILNIMTQTNGIYNVWTPQRNLHAKQEKQANNLSHLFLPSVANKKRPQESSDLETSKRLCFEGSSMILSWKVPKTAASCSFACNSGFAIITWNNPKK